MKLPNLHYSTLDAFCICMKQFCKICSEKKFVVQCFIMIVCNSHIQQFTYAVYVKSKWINGQMNIYTTHNVAHYSEKY